MSTLSGSSPVFVSQHLRLKYSSLLNIGLNCKFEFSMLSSYLLFSLFNSKNIHYETKLSRSYLLEGCIIYMLICAFGGGKDFIDRVVGGKELIVGFDG